MNFKNSVIRQGEETFESLICLATGTAVQLLPRYPGDIRFLFENESLLAEFNFLSSVMYFDELLVSSKNFPYIEATENRGGLYQVLGSSYLARLHEDKWVSCKSFQKHKHFIYYGKPDDFGAASGLFWHITSESVTTNKTPLNGSTS